MLVTNFRGLISALYPINTFDHCQAAKKLNQRGVEIFAGVETAQELDLKQPKIVFSQQGQEYSCLSAPRYSIWPFEVPHGDIKNHAYLTKAGEGNLLFYATDCMNIPVLPKNLTHLMVECNYVEKRLDSATLGGGSSVIHAKQSITNHMSLETLLAWLKKLDKSQLQQIWLLHLSSEFGDPKYCKEKVQKATGVEVYLA